MKVGEEDNYFQTTELAVKETLLVMMETLVKETMMAVMMMTLEERVEIHRPLMRKSQGMKPFIRFPENKRQNAPESSPLVEAFNSNSLEMTSAHLYMKEKGKKRVYYTKKEEYLQKICCSLIENFEKRETILRNV